MEVMIMKKSLCLFLIFAMAFTMIAINPGQTAQVEAANYDTYNTSGASYLVAGMSYRIRQVYTGKYLNYSGGDSYYSDSGQVWVMEKTADYNANRPFKIKSKSGSQYLGISSDNRLTVFSSASSSSTTFDFSTVSSNRDREYFLKCNGKYLTEYLTFVSGPVGSSNISCMWELIPEHMGNKAVESFSGTYQIKNASSNTYMTSVPVLYGSGADVTLKPHSTESNSENQIWKLESYGRFCYRIKAASEGAVGYGNYIERGSSYLSLPGTQSSDTYAAEWLLVPSPRNNGKYIIHSVSDGRKMTGSYGISLDSGYGEYDAASDLKYEWEILPAAAPAASMIGEQTNYMVRNVYSNTYIAGVDNASKTGQEIQMRDYTNSAPENQLWRMEAASSNYYRFKAVTPDTLSYNQYWSGTQIGLAIANRSNSSEYSYVKVSGSDTRFIVFGGSSSGSGYLKYDNGRVVMTSSWAYENATGSELLKYQWEFCPVDDVLDGMTFEMNNMYNSNTLLGVQNGNQFDVKAGYPSDNGASENKMWQFEKQANGNFRIKAIAPGTAVNGKYIERQGDTLRVPNVNTNIAEFKIEKVFVYYGTLYLIRSVSDGKLLRGNTSSVSLDSYSYNPSNSFQSRGNYEWRLWPV